MLEIGAGAGWQAQRLVSQGFDTTGIDIEQVSELSYNYEKERIYNVIIYDGHTIPFPDETFDVIFSSNVLEHIPHIREFQKEIRRVLKNSGTCIHLVPAPVWRFWSIITYYLVRFKNVFSKKSKKQSEWIATKKAPPLLKRLIIRRHGERGNVLLEFKLFRQNSWKSLFTETNWKIKSNFPGGLFLTGEMFLGKNLSVEARKKLSKYLGSYCHIFILEKNHA